MKRELKIVSPHIECYVADASFFATLVNENQQICVLNDYIQLVYKLYDDTPQYNVLMYIDTGYAWSSEGVTARRYTYSEIINGKENIYEFVCNSISNEYYILLSLDEYYIHTHWFYKNTHSLHDYLIYGFDDLKKEILMCGYTSQSRYEKFRISKQNLCKAFLTMTPEEGSWNDYIQIFKKKPNLCGKLNLQKIANLLYKYIESEICFPDYAFSVNEKTDKFVYGINVYGIVLEKLNNCDGLIDLRMLRMIWEHKKLMKQRVKYLRHEINRLNYSLECEFCNIEKRANICFLLGVNIILHLKVN